MSLPALSTATFMPWATPAAAARSSAMCEVNDISPLLLFFLVGQEVKGNYCWPEREAGGGRARLLHHSPCPEKLSSFLLASSLLFMVRRSD